MSATYYYQEFRAISDDKVRGELKLKLIMSLESFSVVQSFQAHELCVFTRAETQIRYTSFSAFLKWGN